MNLTNEEKKRIADAATTTMQAFCELRMAEDRLRTMNGLVGSILHMGMDKGMMEMALLPYVERMKKSQVEFFKVLGIEESNKEFWEYNAKEEAWKREQETAKKTKSVS